MNFEAPPLDIPQALLNWVMVFVPLLCIGLGIGFLLSLILHGGKGVGAFFTGLGEGLADLFKMSMRRIWAISSLTIKECLRRKTLAVFVVFAVLFMFGGWFLSKANTREDLQLSVYVSFVLTTIGWLILPVALLLSCWGIPEDIRLRSLHTVVTKPVRRSEIVVGRVLGYSVVGTIIVCLMSVLGYVWILRQVPESVKSKLIARVPVYGELGFTDRQGATAASGVNTGDINAYRSYIEGATKARAIWTFEGVDADALRTNPDSEQPELMLENTFQAFRTHKGDINKTLNCQLTLINPTSKLRVALSPFPVQEFGENIRWIPKDLSYYDEEANVAKQVDLLEDVVDDGKLVVEARCVDVGQFLGMARPDLFVRLPDRSFASTYFKSTFGIWMMMVLIIVLGVTASTFLKGPVATLLTFTVILIGATGFHQFMIKVTQGEVKGSGMLEAGIRIINHGNPNADADKPQNAFVRIVDRATTGFIRGIQYVFPDFGSFRYTAYAAHGYDVPTKSAILPGVFVLLGFLLPCFLLSYFSLKLRELEAK